MSNDHNEHNAGVFIIFIVGIIALFQKKGAYLMQLLITTIEALGMFILTALKATMAGLALAGSFYLLYKGVSATMNVISSFKDWKKSVDKFIKKSSDQQYDFDRKIGIAEDRIEELSMLLKKQNQQISILEDLVGITEKESVEQASNEIVKDFI